MSATTRDFKVIGMNVGIYSHSTQGWTLWEKNNSALDFADIAIGMIIFAFSFFVFTERAIKIMIFFWSLYQTNMFLDQGTSVAQ